MEKDKTVNVQEKSCKYLSPKFTKWEIRFNRGWLVTCLSLEIDLKSKFTLRWSKVSTIYICKEIISSQAPKIWELVSESNQNDKP